MAMPVEFEVGVQKSESTECQSPLDCFLVLIDVWRWRSAVISPIRCTVGTIRCAMVVVYVYERSYFRVINRIRL